MFIDGRASNISSKFKNGFHFISLEISNECHDLHLTGVQSAKIKNSHKQALVREREDFTDEENVQTKSNFLQKTFHSRQTLIA
ncbi:MAG TPA: hypothetical protein VFP71_07165 [Candidatus Angelobacter sp.]|nr:hypothetical protein [Candidatus Angelobacter sp.]